MVENNKSVANQKTEWSVICACAMSQFESMCTKICNGDVTIDELNNIQARQDQMSKLCQAATSSESPSCLPSFSEIKKELEDRLKEFEFFTNYKDQILQFVTQMGKLPLEGNLITFSFNT